MINRALYILSNEYGVTDSCSENPRIATLGVQSCVAVAFMMRDRFNTAAVCHFSAHAQIGDDADTWLKRYVDAGIQNALADIGYEPHKRLRAGLAGGIKGWGKSQSDLLTKHARNALSTITGLDLELDCSMQQKDICADSAQGIIRIFTSKDLQQTIGDNCDGEESNYADPKNLQRLKDIDHGINGSTTGSYLVRHPLSSVAKVKSKNITSNLRLTL